MKIPPLGSVLDFLQELNHDLNEVTPTTGPLIEAFSALSRNAASEILVPAVSKLEELVQSKEGRSLVFGLVALGASGRKVAAEARLTKDSRACVDAISKVKALDAKAQLDAFRSAGFSLANSMRLLEQLIIADAIRYTKPAVSFQNLPKKTKGVDL